MTEPSRMPLLHPVTILWPVSSLSDYLWNVPNRCFWAYLSQSLVAPDPTCLKRIAGIKFTISIGLYLQRSMKLTRKNINIVLYCFHLTSFQHMWKRMNDQLFNSLCFTPCPFFCGIWPISLLFYRIANFIDNTGYITKITAKYHFFNDKIKLRT